MSGSVVPIRRDIEIEDAPRPDTRVATIRIGEDGQTEIEIGGTGKPARQKRRSTKDFDANLAEEMDSGALAALAAHLLEEIEADEGDRAEWLETANAAADYLGVRLEDPATSVGRDGTICQAVAACLLKAAMKLWSTSYAELLPVGGPVKVEREESAQQVPNEAGGGGGIMAAGGGASVASGSEPGQEPTTQTDMAGDDLAEALERDMNWYLTVGDRGYYPDTSKMLMQRNLIGLAFKEVYKCPVARKPLSRFVRAQDLIIQGDPADINETDGRVTVRKKISQSRMRRMQKAGVYVDVPLVRPTGDKSESEIVVGEVTGIGGPTLPRDFEHTVFETVVELGSGTTHDLFGDLEMLEVDERGRDPGYPLPYRVSLDKDSRQVLSIRRAWKRGDADHRRRKRFVKYGFIPAFGFYDWGLIHIAGNPTQAATMLQRSGVDAGLLGNFPAWAMKQGPASKLEQTVFRPNAGEVVKVPISGNDKLGDALMAWPYKPPSPESMALLAKLEGDVQALAGVVEIPVGEGRIGNTPVGTIMSYIESVSMVPGAVHKADHVAQAEEFEMLRELLAEEPECLTRGNKNPARAWQVGEELLSPDLTPKADPNTPSQIHRLLKIQGLVAAGGLPQFAGIADNRKIYRRAVEVLVGQDAAEFEMPEAPPTQAPDPRIEAAQINAASKDRQGQQKLQEADLEHQGKMAELAIESQDRAADREATNQRELLKAGVQHAKSGADLVTEGAGLAHEAQENALDRSHEAGQQAGQQLHETLTAPLSGNGEDQG